MVPVVRGVGTVNPVVARTVVMVVDEDASGQSPEDPGQDGGGQDTEQHALHELNPP